MAAPSPRGPAPVPVRRAAAVVLLEGLGLLVLCAGYAARVLFGRPENAGLALTGAVMGLLAGAVVVLLARALAHHRRAAASPVLVTQLLALPVGIGLWEGHLPLYGVAVLLPAVVVLALLVATAGGRTIFSA